MKTPLYDKTRGGSNRDLAMSGPHGKHPAFSALKNLQGVEIALRRMAGTSDARKLKPIAPAVAGQMTRAWAALKKAAQTSGKTRKDTMRANMRFAEAVAAFFEENQTEKPRDKKRENEARILSTLIEMQTREGEPPTQAELRADLKRRGRTYPQKQWERFLERTGLADELPSMAQKAAGKKQAIRPPDYAKKRAAMLARVAGKVPFSDAELQAAAMSISERKRAREGKQ